MSKIGERGIFIPGNVKAEKDEWAPGNNTCISYVTGYGPAGYWLLSATSQEFYFENLFC